MREPFLINEFTQQFIDRGKAEDVLLVLHARGVTVPKSARERIANCRDLDQLGTWIDRAITADNIHDVLDD